MRIGVDFDNTIVRYDSLFHQVCRERGLIPPDLPASKSAIRDHLRCCGCEEVWTELQGYVYGARMAEAEPFPGVIEFFQACRESGTPVYIISHKTRYPYLGQRYDLHQAALEWLDTHGFFAPDRINLPRERVFFTLTKEDKLTTIRQSGCTHFIDDLPEFLLEPAFPAAVGRVLFDPNNRYPDSCQYLRVRDWATCWNALTS
jgi:hypothetical protein